MSDTNFKPTTLDLALQHDPVARASEHDILAAAHEPTEGVSETNSERELMPAEGQEATLEGQRVTAAASLAAGMIAAEGQPVTPAEAVQKVRAVLNEMDHV